MGEAGVAIAGLLAGGAGLVSGLFGGGAGSATTGGDANPLPSNSGVVATDDPVRRREDEEGGVSDNPQIDGMNPDRRDLDRDLTNKDIKELIRDFDYGEGLETQVASLDNITSQKRYGLRDADLQAKLKIAEKFLTPLDKKNLENSDSYKNGIIAVRNDLTDFNKAKNIVINLRLATLGGTQDTKALMDKVLDKSPREFQNYVDSQLTPRKDLIIERIDLLHKKQDLESKLANGSLSTSERSKIEKQLVTIADRSATIDTNIQNYQLNMKASDTNESYVKKVKESFIQERDGLKKLVAELKSERDRLDSQTPKNSSQIESLKTQLKGLNERLTTATHGAERTTELLKFMNRESIALPEGVKSPVGDSESNRSITLNSSFGWDGYGRLSPNTLYNEILGAGGKHYGIDIRGSIGDRVNSVLDGKLKYTTIGADTTVPESKALRAAGVIYLPEGTNADGTRREAGFYNPNSSTPNARLSADDLRKIDPKLKSGQEFNLKKVGLQYEDGKGYYTMDINGNGKDRNYLNDAQVSALPSHVTENPTKLSGNGNSIAIETKIGGIKYDVIYKHLNEIPVTPSDGQFKAGMQIGTLGTTGSSNGAHLHLEVISHERPNIPADLYETRGNHYVINPEYFLRVMANGGANASGE